MKILKQTYDRLINIPPAPPERGGILGGNNEEITVFIEDNGSLITTEYKYRPNTEFLNIIIGDWMNNGIDFMGICHTHPNKSEALSNADIEYINQIMKSVRAYTDRLYFPLIIPKEKKIICYLALIIADEIKVFEDAIQLI